MLSIEIALKMDSGDFPKVVFKYLPMAMFHFLFEKTEEIPQH